MAYKQPSSGPFKMMGSSPVKQDNFNLTGNSKSTTPGYSTTKAANKGLPKNFNTTGTSKAGKIARYLSKGSKFLLGKGLGIAGVILGSTTTATADQPKGKAKKKGSYTNDFTKLK